MSHSGERESLLTREIEDFKKKLSNHKVDPVAVVQLILFMYTGTIEVREKNVQNLLPAANLLQLTEVRDACCDFLKDQLHPTNCLRIKEFADVHSCMELLSEAQSYAQKHFSKVMESEEFYSLSHNAVIELISNTELGILSEEDVFEAVIGWTKYNRDERSCHLPELLDHVRFLYLSKDYLVRRVCEEELLQTNPECKDFLINALNYHLIPPGERSALAAAIQCPPRKRIGIPQSVLIVGGQAPKAIKSVEIYDVQNHTCRPCPELQSRRCRCGVTVLDGSVYAVGGFDGTSRVR